MAATLTPADLAAMGRTVVNGVAVRINNERLPRDLRMVRRSEKAEQYDADRMADLLGFRSVHFSQSRASQQTPGIPDRLYLHGATGASFWWEAKAWDGRISVAQEQMHADLRACHHAVVIGTAAAAIVAMQRIIATGESPDDR